MDNKDKIREICENSIQSLGEPLSNAIANAIFEGYKLGWMECLKKFNLISDDERLDR